MQGSWKDQNSSERADSRMKEELGEKANCWEV